MTEHEPDASSVLQQRMAAELDNAEALTTKALDCLLMYYELRSMTGAYDGRLDDEGPVERTLIRDVLKDLRGVIEFTRSES